ncbi:nuclear transport factor 2 family protein [Streptomyces sp. NPDC127168]|uniref:nuclear transport factor 2 family protein n=1 Tax=unclassified Streptomyces TaxID=2593676 RepID=UPI003631E7FD
MTKRDDPRPGPSGATTATDVTAVAQLVLHERHARDRGWWNDMRRGFADDSGVRLSWFQGTGPDFVSASERMAERGDVSVHRLAPPVVDVNGDRALAVVPAGIEVRTDLDGVEADLVSYARLLYRAERRPDGWRIVALDPVYERDTLSACLPGTPLTVTAAELAGFRRPYRMLSYVLSRRGYTVAQDLYGDDRPGAVRALEQAAADWLSHRARQGRRDVNNET